MKIYFISNIFRITLQSSPVGPKNEGKEINKASNIAVQDSSKPRIFVAKRKKSN